MENNVKIREAEFDDVRQIKEILFNAFEEYEIALPDNYSVADIDSIQAKSKQDPKFVLVRDDTVIGFLLLKPLSEESIELKRLYLASAERGQGLGQFLINFAINYVCENDYKFIRLETTSKYKEAVSLYKKCGFIELKDVERAIGHDLVFEKRLRS